jgi:hypothetical protein
MWSQNIWKKTYQAIIIEKKLTNIGPSPSIQDQTYKFENPNLRK